MVTGLFFLRSTVRPNCIHGTITDYTGQYPELINLSQDNIILDGEVAATDENGRVDFEAIMERFSLRKPNKIRRAAEDRLITGEDRDYVYLEPRIKAKVKIRNWTKAGLLRSPAFVDFIL